MKFDQLHEKIKNFPIVNSQLLTNLTSNKNIIRRQTSEWVQKNKLHQLKRGIYTLSSSDREKNFRPTF